MGGRGVEHERGAHRGAKASARAARTSANTWRISTTTTCRFGIGPAGTGKTYLAVACAVEALLAERVRRIVLVRPAVEAGERLGFLPGDMAQKVDPYLRPMYDALYEMMGYDRVARFIERNAIEVAPLAFMRGRSLNESFIILDEAQNSTIEQMKMFLTRIGFGSRAVVTGDLTQTDLPTGRMSGLHHAQLILRGVAGVAFTFFDAGDVVRHPLVQRIVQAYESHEHQHRAMKVSIAALGARVGWRADPARELARLGRCGARAAAAGARRSRCCWSAAARSRALNARYRRRDRPPTCCPSRHRRCRQPRRAARRSGDLPGGAAAPRRARSASACARTGHIWWCMACCT